MPVSPNQGSTGGGTLVTITGINIGRLIGGALIVETIFALPGIGRLLVGAILTRDLIILQGVVLLVAAGFVEVHEVPWPSPPTFAVIAQRPEK